MGRIWFWISELKGVIFATKELITEWEKEKKSTNVKCERIQNKNM